MKSKLLVLAIFLIAAFIGEKLYLDNRGFTPWMTMKEMDQYLKPQPSHRGSAKVEGLTAGGSFRAMATPESAYFPAFRR